MTQQNIQKKEYERKPTAKAFRLLTEPLTTTTHYLMLKAYIKTERKIIAKLFGALRKILKRFAALSSLFLIS